MGHQINIKNNVHEDQKPSLTNSSVVDLGHQINRTRTITNHTEYKTDHIILIIDNYTSIMVKYGWRILRPLSKICKSSQKWIRLACWKSTKKCCSSASSRQNMADGLRICLCTSKSSWQL